MKKITLAFLSVIGLCGSIIAQPTVTLSLPPSNSNSQLRAPNSTSQQAGLKGVYLLKPSECQPFFALTNSMVTRAGFDLYAGNGGTNVSGQFTLYLQNTTDVAYSKGTNFATALSGMTAYYTGNLTLPGSPTNPYLMVACTPTFNYTGGGIYVAIAWSSPGPFAANPITYNANYISGSALGATDYSSVAPTSGTAMVTSDFRPAFTFAAANTATNELSMIAQWAPGTLAKEFNSGYQAVAYIKNGSVGALTNVSVAMVSTGANAFTNVQVVPTITAGGIQSVTFAAFNPTVSGQNNIIFSVPPDQSSTNNSLSWTQSVTCTGNADHPVGFAYTTGYATGSAGGNITSKYNFAGACSLTDVNLAINNSTTNTGNTMYGVILDATGAITQSTNPVAITANTTAKFVFNPPVALSAGTDYYIGVAQTTNTFFPFNYGDYVTPILTDYWYFPLIGGAAPVAWGIPNGYLGITANVLVPTLSITAAPSRTKTCKGETNTITVSGQSGFTYTYNATPSTTNTTFTFSNSGTPATGFVGYTVTGTDPTIGCKTNAAVVNVSVSLCTGINENSNFSNNISVFPNPAVNGKVNITGLNDANTITVYNAIGQAVLSFNTNEEQTVVDLKDFPNGNYLIKITNAGRESKTVKIVNQN